MRDTAQALRNLLAMLAMLTAMVWCSCAAAAAPVAKAEEPLVLGINEGATVILPVFHPGALLFIGDGHALQADGEPTGTGIETSLDITFTVELRKQGNCQ